MMHQANGGREEEWAEHPQGHDRRHQTQPGPMDPMRRYKDSGEEAELVMCNGEM